MSTVPTATTAMYVPQMEARTALTHCQVIEAKTQEEPSSDIEEATQDVDLRTIDEKYVHDTLINVPSLISSLAQRNFSIHGYDMILERTGWRTRASPKQMRSV